MPVPVETCNGHRAGITVAASPMAAFVRSGSPMAEVGDDETVTLLSRETIVPRGL
jgi:hypothetical protein